MDNDHNCHLGASKLIVSFLESTVQRKITWTYPPGAILNPFKLEKESRHSWIHFFAVCLCGRLIGTSLRIRTSMELFVYTSGFHAGRERGEEGEISRPYLLCFGKVGMSRPGGKDSTVLPLQKNPV